MASRTRTEAALAVALAVVALGLVLIGGLFYFGSIVQPVHKDAASIPSSSVAPTDAAFATAIDDARRMARALLVDENLPGLSLAVSVDGATVWSEGFGYADVSRAPVTPATRFRLGALSKPLTAFAVGRLRDRGRLDLDAPIQRYVPAYPAKPWPLTVRHLMGDVGGVHRSRGDNVDGDSMPTQACTNLDEAVGLFANDPLKFEPGTQHRYSIFGWVLVSAAIEGASGLRFDDVMRKDVFEPLDLTRTIVVERPGTDDAASYAPRSVLRYALHIAEDSAPEYSCLAGAGAFLSTPSDLVRFGAAMTKPGALGEDTWREMQTPTRLASGAVTTYALGWTVGTADLAGVPARVLSHRGNPRGASVSLVIFPDAGIAVAAAAGRSGDAGIHPLALKIADRFKRR